MTLPTTRQASGLHAGGSAGRGAVGGKSFSVSVRWALARVVVADEVADPGHDLLAPFAAVEDAVMADPGLLPVDVAGARDVGGERVGGLGLADARDVVELAFDRHQGGLAKGGIDLATAAPPGTSLHL